MRQKEIQVSGDPPRGFTESCLWDRWITIMLGHDRSMTQLQTRQRAEADGDSEFDTTGCYARHIQ